MERRNNRIEHDAGVTHTNHGMFILANIDFGLLHLQIPPLENAPRRTRTYNQLIKSQMTDLRKSKSVNGLRIVPVPVPHSFPTDTCQNDPDFVVVKDAWPNQPEAFRAGILAMVKAASGK